MLTAITVLAVVGGALAFKAQKMSLPKICYGDAANNCPNFAVNSTVADAGGIFKFYTTTEGTDCQGAVCPTQTHLVKEVE